MIHSYVVHNITVYFPHSKVVAFIRGSLLFLGLRDHELAGTALLVMDVEASVDLLRECPVAIFIGMERVTHP